MIAGLVCFPLARLALIFDRVGFNSEWLPLSAYKELSFYTKRTDALDCFGTRLEQRFTKEKIFQMMTKPSLQDIHFNECIPYW